MSTYQRPLRSDELMHFGVKGMHWGERRYQNEDGSYTEAGRAHYGIGAAIKSFSENAKSRSQERKRRNTYDYRKSDAYKNGSSAKKREMSNMQRTNSRFLGKKSANRIAYDRDVKGMTQQEAAKRELIRKVAGVTIAVAASAAVAHYGKKYISAKYNNAVINEYARNAGLNYVKGGFNPKAGSKAASHGMKMARHLVSSEGVAARRKYGI